MQTQNILPVSTSSQNQSLIEKRNNAMKRRKVEYILRMENNFLVRVIRWLQHAKNELAYYALLIPNKLGLVTISAEEKDAMVDKSVKRKARLIELLSAACDIQGRAVQLSEPQICPICATNVIIFVHPDGICTSCWFDKCEKLLMETPKEDK